MHQRKYITEVLKRFQMLNCNPAAVPVEAGTRSDELANKNPTDATLFRQMVGCLKFVCHSRPEIAYGAGLISRHMANPTQAHMAEAKKILRYIKGTLNYGILFPRQRTTNALQLTGFSDSDWFGDKEDRRNTSGQVFYLCGAPISWNSKKQSVVTLSTCEAEYIAACNAACQGLWLSSLMTDLKCGDTEKFELMVDNKSTINLARNSVSHGRSKHIDTKFYFIRDQVSKGSVELVHCPTEFQIADIITKPLKIERFEKLRDKLGVVKFESQPT